MGQLIHFQSVPFTSPLFKNTFLSIKPPCQVSKPALLFTPLTDTITHSLTLSQTYTPTLTNSLSLKVPMHQLVSFTHSLSLSLSSNKMPNLKHINTSSISFSCYQSPSLSLIKRHTHSLSVSQFRCFLSRRALHFVPDLKSCDKQGFQLKLFGSMLVNGQIDKLPTVLPICSDIVQQIISILAYPVLFYYNVQAEQQDSNSDLRLLQLSTLTTRPPLHQSTVQQF